jgi:fructokinase
MTDLFGGIEAGGTKMVCMVASGPGDIRDEVRFPTTTPEETLEKVVDYFRKQSDSEPIAALGIAAFGPLDLDPVSPTYGYITTTPKPGWSQVDILGYLQDALQWPVMIDTDVNGAALGEYRWGAAQGIDPFIYLTLGTGIGGGGLYNGALMHGLVHPEMGHQAIPHDLEKDPFPGSCGVHGDCFEGLASGTAINTRWGRPAENLPEDHPAWDLEAGYISQALCNLILTLSPKRIILGGGVMKTAWLFPLVRQNVLKKLKGYISSPAIQENIDRYITPPGLGDKAGVLGAIALAQLTLMRRDI